MLRGGGQQGEGAKDIFLGEKRRWTQKMEDKK